MCEIFGRIFLWLCRSVSVSNWIEILKIVGAAVAFGIGLRQYSKAQVWKRLEFIGAEMRVFFDECRRSVGPYHVGLAQEENCALQIPRRR
jgi:hypothetical protein